MVVLVVDEFHIFTDESKGDAPISVDPDGPETSEVSLERVGSKAWDLHIDRRPSNVEHAENASKLRHMFRLHPGLRVSLVERLEAFMPETNDHRISVKCIVSLNKSVEWCYFGGLGTAPPYRRSREA